ncbi:MAG TPA: hypothetical protein VMW69_11780 [Spirochaetia bacterium]|nr:hypothetical protein [Spirochaetia bacterium]
MEGQNDQNEWGAGVILTYPIPVMILLYAGIWIILHFGCGYIAHRMPAGIFEPASPIGRLLRARQWESEGGIYRVIGIGKWKGLLPEAGALFRGGFNKRRLRTLDAAYLEGFRRETNRAELSHWLTLISGMSFFLWNPWQIGSAMVGYAILTNLPFIAIQRYNRPRLDNLAGWLATRERPRPANR